MPLSLNDLIRRGDVCFFCGYHIGIEGQTTCPECGRSRPSERHIARVKDAIAIGKVGLATLATVVGILVCTVAYAALPFEDPFSIAGLFFCLMFVAVLVVAHFPWFREFRPPFVLFRQPRRCWLMAAYPWVWLAISAALIGLPLAWD